MLADAVKDSGAVSMFPPLAGEWLRQVDAQRGWRIFSRQTITGCKLSSVSIRGCAEARQWPRLPLSKYRGVRLPPLDLQRLGRNTTYPYEA
jgi:hypothetical protein